ncbi:MAG: type II secretion system inner membrane protein GspF [Candidatus Rokubacteria bacterium]|nr:type II secretion system inner membrane protein GspF [Candidatus Rokubacteria bacterium]
MPVFTYTAADTAGRRVSGRLDAKDEIAAVVHLQAQRLFPLDVREAREEAPGWRWGLPGISTRELQSFTQQLATLLTAGVELDRALAIQTELTHNRNFRRIIAQVRESVQGGSSLAEALARHPRVFSRLYVSMVSAGEAGGVLEQLLARLATFLAGVQELKDYLVTSLIYPVFLAVVGTSTVTLLLVFVLPQFTTIFQAMGGTLPLPTQILLGVSGFLTAYWWLVAGGLAAAVVGARQFVATPGGGLAWDRLKLRLPLVGVLLQKTEVARWARTLGTLVESGIPFFQATRIVKETVGNRVIAQAMDSVAEGVKKGAGIAVPLRESGVFPPLAIHMISVGEESGRLEEMLLRVAEAYDTEVRTGVKRLISLLEPIMIVAMGIVVGLVVISILLAIFSINDLPL